MSQPSSTTVSTPISNPVGLRGIEFTEFSGPSLPALEELFWAFGFSKLRRHASKDISYFRQNDIHFLLNGERDGHSAQFARKHGPSISAMGWRVENAEAALKAAVARGAVEVPAAMKDHAYPAVWGIGESIIYFIDAVQAGLPSIYERDFIALEQPRIQADKGFLVVDHLTNNVLPGEQDKWAAFYKGIFGFTEVRYFDIQGVKTGLTSFALRSPDGSFCIPINQPKDDKDQIAEYLREYKGPGVQHLAFLTEDILASLDQLEGSGIETLEIDADYYREVFERVPGVREDHGRIQKHQVLVDGDEQGYLLQIFTKNIIGPIFVEIIQRANNLGFGEGNFGALFRSLEKDQERRGVI
ncbi:4-hydroxyphenylpyruvate dioxygenase [Paucibacter sp. APW11]|uniref:4-hydroxyphenylpyruvate dioxygenase n=1 Tax=Roseateles aquae TaxID=3077235 RepID=A0ABU3PCT9_9BURK|nr:4-hydroxyphenylpyruvate dioxygenase [Paucibacter sp. APW11]MDT9000396.1 4-hydroxyphenylpyruvate dioxygenase [Paucibacter sp. APW11]